MMITITILTSVFCKRFVCAFMGSVVLLLSVSQPGFGMFKDDVVTSDASKGGESLKEKNALELAKKEERVAEEEWHEAQSLLIRTEAKLEFGKKQRGHLLDQCDKDKRDEDYNFFDNYYQNVIKKKELKLESAKKLEIQKQERYKESIKKREKAEIALKSTKQNLGKGDLSVREDEKFQAIKVPSSHPEGGDFVLYNQGQADSERMRGGDHLGENIETVEKEYENAKAALIEAEGMVCAAEERLDLLDPCLQPEQERNSPQYLEDVKTAELKLQEAEVKLEEAEKRMGEVYQRYHDGIKKREDEKFQAIKVPSSNPEGGDSVPYKQGQMDSERMRGGDHLGENIETVEKEYEAAKKEEERAAEKYEEAQIARVAADDQLMLAAKALENCVENNLDFTFYDQAESDLQEAKCLEEEAQKECEMRKEKSKEAKIALTRIRKELEKGGGFSEQDPFIQEEIAKYDLNKGGGFFGLLPQAKSLDEDGEYFTQHSNKKSSKKVTSSDASFNALMKKNEINVPYNPKKVGREEVPNLNINQQTEQQIQKSYSDAIEKKNESQKRISDLKQQIETLEKGEDLGEECKQSEIDAMMVKLYKELKEEKDNLQRINKFLQELEQERIGYVRSKKSNRSSEALEKE